MTPPLYFTCTKHAQLALSIGRWENDQGKEGKYQEKEGKYQGKEGKDQRKEGKDQGKAGKDQGKAGKDQGKAGKDQGKERKVYLNYRYFGFWCLLHFLTGNNPTDAEGRSTREGALSLVNS